MRRIKLETLLGGHADNTVEFLWMKGHGGVVVSSSFGVISRKFYYLLFFITLLFILYKLIQYGNRFYCVVKN
jgi:hypothetical protein